MKKRLLAFDFGASSGRAMLGEFDGERIALTEVHRFDNNPVTVRGTFYWDVLALFHEIKQGITKAKALGNIAVQLMAQGDIGDVWEARRIISNSFEPVEYLPEDVPAWEAAYARFKQYILPGG